MAFRMVIDLGYFSDRPFDGTDAQQPAHQALSFHLRRALTLLNALSTLLEPSNDMIEQQPWTACGTEQTTMVHTASPSNAAMCFSNLCAIGKVVNEILLGIYSERHTEDAGLLIRSTRQKLENGVKIGLRS
ncbi:uncharacterized protein A1O9_06100 [Exophiala aquamarina CBS 119918]|uniref:Uncharacterized protein n=1 Tax=Exophiala aquamarina CBS 119918 TaxID=1182545 RepID=A0A072PDK0_9EURO|nr:uncharacterized protein A1O9_06100 [Exophiala aquamarina CBS 119918]KEF58174.1 hypothetical protein A1O9_06100 [Exophiala aquamarina CBS 119918]